MATTANCGLSFRNHIRMCTERAFNLTAFAVRVATRARPIRMMAAMAWSTTVVSNLPAQLGLLNKGGANVPVAAQVIVKTEPDSPRASYENFARLGMDGEWDKAAAYLALSPEQVSRGPELARRLKLVLDQRLELVSASISPASMGDTTDGDFEHDRIGVIPVHDFGQMGEQFVVPSEAVDVDFHDPQVRHRRAEMRVHHAAEMAVEIMRRDVDLVGLG